MIRSETPAAYLVTPQQDIVQQALHLLQARLSTPGQALTSPQDVKNYLALKLAEYEHEVFAVLWLDAQNRLIAYEEMFRGTLSQASVYPREVVKAALTHNAAAVIFSHNHPSGEPLPSRADELLTRTLKEALALVDVRTLDHIVIGGVAAVSFAESGLI